MMIKSWAIGVGVTGLVAGISGCNSILGIDDPSLTGNGGVSNGGTAAGVQAGQAGGSAVGATGGTAQAGASGYAGQPRAGGAGGSQLRGGSGGRALGGAGGQATGGVGGKSTGGTAGVTGGTAGGQPAGGGTAVGGGIAMGGGIAVGGNIAAGGVDTGGVGAGGVGTGGTVPVCVPMARDCGSAEDKDCDGSPDNTTDTVCQCAPGTTRECSPHAGFDGKGICKAGTQTCVAVADNASSSWGACTGAVGPADRDCSSTADNNCDGAPDDTVDEVCTCAVGASQTCDAHAGFDGKGICKAGSQACVAAADGLSSSWGACTGAVGPKSRDCTSALDNNCDGSPDNVQDAACTCTAGTSQACDTHAGFDGKGICKAGNQNCVAAADGLSSVWGPCTGAVAPAARNCSSTADNDCDGVADNTLDTVCKCVAGNSQACNTHGALDGKGICKAGGQTCAAAADGSSTLWGACTGAVGPSSRNCASTADNDCDGLADNTVDSMCQCTAGTSQTCNAHAGYDGKGICKAGGQTCVAAADTSTTWSTCTGAVGPAARNCSSTGDNNCDGVADNTLDTVCKCVAGNAQACDTHPGYDGKGICKAGSQTCAAAADNSSTSWGGCSGAVGPTTETCAADGRDEDCDGQINEDPPCNTPPSLVSTDPANGATGVIRKVAIRLTFSEAIAASSVSATLQLGGKTVATTVSVSGAVVTIQPSVPLALLGSYQLVVKGTLADLAGGQLGSDVTLNFSVQGGTLVATRRLDTQETVEVGAPEIRDDGTGTITVVWDDASGQSIWWDRRDRATLSWGTASKLSTGTTLTCPILAFDGTGRGVVMWTRGTNELVAQRVAADGSLPAVVAKDFGVDMTTACNSGSFHTTERYFAMVGDVALLADNNGQPPVSVEYGWTTGWGDQISAGCRSIVAKFVRGLSPLSTGAFLSAWDGNSPGASLPGEAWVCSYTPSAGWSLHKTLATFNTGTTYFGWTMIGADASNQAMVVSDSQKKLWWNRTVGGAWQTNADLNTSQVAVRAFAVGPGGHAIVAWDNGSAIYGQAYDPTSQAWSSAAQLSTTTTTAYEVWAGVDARGNGLIGWLNNANASSSGCLDLARYTVQGGWAARQTVPGSYGDTCSDLTGAATAQGDMVLAWRQIPMYATLKVIRTVAFE